MIQMRKLLVVLAAAVLLLGGALSLTAATALAQPSHAADNATSYPIIGGADGHSDGTLTITNDESNDTVTITLTPNAGLSFTGGFVCVGDNNSANTSTAYFKPGSSWSEGSASSDGFTARVNPGNGSNGCPPAGAGASYFVLQQFSGGGPWSMTVPPSFFSDGMYLQIHVTVSNGDTGMGCGTYSVSPFYGNCPDVPPTTEVPVGTVGGLGLAVLVGGALGFVQWKRSRSHRRARAEAA